MVQDDIQTIEIKSESNNVVEKIDESIQEYVKCTACSKILSIIRRKLYRHPKLSCLICKACLKFINAQTYERDEVGIEELCTWCGDGGKLICCDYCEKAYCKGCLKRNFGESFVTSLSNQADHEKWKCLFCNKQQIASLINHCDAVMKFIEKQKRQDSIVVSNGLSNSERLDRIVKVENDMRDVKTEPVKYISSFPRYEDDSVEIVSNNEGYIDSDRNASSISSENKNKNVTSTNNVSTSTSTPHTNSTNKNEKVNHVSQRSRRSGKPISYNEDKLQKQAEEKAQLKQMSNKKKRPLVTIEISDSSEESSNDELIVIKKNGKKRMLSKSLVLAAHAALKKKENEKNKRKEKPKEEPVKKKKDLSFLRLSLKVSNNNQSESDASLQSMANSSDDEDEKESTSGNESDKKAAEKSEKIIRKKQKSTKSNEQSKPIIDDEQKPGPSGIPKKSKPYKRKPRKKQNSDSSDMSDGNNSNSKLIQYTPMRNTLTAEDHPFTAAPFSPQTSSNISTPTVEKQTTISSQVSAIDASSKDTLQPKDMDIATNSNPVSEDVKSNEEQVSKSVDEYVFSENASEEPLPVEMDEENPEGEENNQENAIDKSSVDFNASPNNDEQSTVKEMSSEKNTVNEADNVDENVSIEETEKTSSANDNQTNTLNLQPVVVLSDMKVDKIPNSIKTDLISSSSDEDMNISNTVTKRKTRSARKKENSDSDSDFEIISKPTTRKSQRNKKTSKQRSSKQKTSNRDSDASVASKESDDQSSSGSSSIEKSYVASSSDSDDEPIIISRKKKTKQAKKKKKVTSVDVSSGNEEDDDNETLTPSKRGRKRIRRILKDNELTEETLHARKLEEQRRKRLLERTLKEQESITKVLDVVEGEYVLEKDDKNQPLVSISKDINVHLKPHQRKGIQFTYDCLIETVASFKKGEEGSGCLLAHCMGLGKSLQIIAFLHTLTYNENINLTKFLVVAPLNTVLNWEQEFEKWIKVDERLDVYVLSYCKDNKDRIRTLKDWYNDGGICIIGYEMYRNLVNYNYIKSKKQKADIKEYLVDPGPDIVICDEGHVLRNSTSAISIAMNGIRTKRRVVLTGTPLQNNLPEYFVMVDFIKPKLLGTRKEFQNRFVNPIHNGQCSNSTPRDVKIMKQRCHVLYQLLSGCVQRQDYSVLTPFLPEKHEFTIFVRLSEKQRKMYQYYLENFVYINGEKLKGSSLFSDFQCLQRISTHPWSLHLERVKAIERNKYKEDDSMDEFLDDEETPDETSESEAETKKKKFDYSSDEESDDQRRRRRRNEITISDDSDSADSEISATDKKPDIKKPFTRQTRASAAASSWKSRDEVDVNGDEIPVEFEKEKYEKEWYDEFLAEEDEQHLELSGKIVLLLEILADAEVVGDKVLVFSQSLVSLDLIETAIVTGTLGGRPYKFCHGVDYFRMDGSTPVQKRQRWAEIFNDPDNPTCRLFLISTRAGSLGINMVAANRVIVFDCSWNPSHDVQSVFRVYRFGQEKKCYIYRFIAQGTMEEKIYERQITKLAVAGRVVDEQQIERHFTEEEIRELYTFAPEDIKDSKTPPLPKDPLLAEVLQRRHPQFIVRYHEHDVLLANVTSEELTEEERQQAWKNYEEEKEMAVRRITHFDQSANAQESSTNSFYNSDLWRMIERERQMIASQMMQNRMGNGSTSIQVRIPPQLSQRDREIYMSNVKNMIAQPVHVAQSVIRQAVPRYQYENGNIRLPSVSNRPDTNPNQVIPSVNQNAYYINRQPHIRVPNFTPRFQMTPQRPQHVQQHVLHASDRERQYLQRPPNPTSRM